MRWSWALCIILAGCLQAPPEHARSDDLVITIDGEGAFLVAVPLPLDAGTSLETWQDIMQAKSVSLGNATLTIAATDRGPALWVDGAGFVVIELRRDITPSCCADAFTQRTWSIPATSALPVYVQAGELRNLRIDHEASSCQGSDCAKSDTTINQYCSLIFRAQGGPGTGWTSVHIRDDAWQCSPAP